METAAKIKQESGINTKLTNTAVPAAIEGKSSPATTSIKSEQMPTLRVLRNLALGKTNKLSGNTSSASTIPKQRLKSQQKAIHSKVCGKSMDRFVLSRGIFAPGSSQRQQSRDKRYIPSTKIVEDQFQSSEATAKIGTEEQMELTRLHMTDNKVEEFLVKHGLERLGPTLEEHQVRWDDLIYLRNNPVETQQLFPVLRDRLDFGKSLKTAMVDKEIQCTLESPIKGNENLIEICQRYDSGKLFLNQYKSEHGKKIYTPESRDYLKKAIVEHYFQRGRGQISHQIFNEMLHIILEELPDEDPAIWYVPGEGKTQKGLLYTRYRYLQQHDKRFRKPKDVILTSVMEQVQKKWEDMTDAEQNACFVSKIKLMNVAYSNYAEVTRHWESSYHLRRYEAVSGNLKFKEWEVIEKYEELGQLITSDFVKINAQDNNKMHERIPQFINNYRTIFGDYKDAVKEDEVLKESMQQAFASGLLSENIIFLSFYSLPLIFRQQYTKSKGNKRIRVSLCETRTSFITLLETEATILETVQARRKAAVERKTTIQPFIIAIGGLNHISSYFVSMDHVLHKTKNIVAAVDLLFKLHSVFHLQYSQECENVLKFLQEYFYELNYPGDKKEPSVAAFITDLKRA